MPRYKLFNKDTDLDLIHPKTGVWYTEDLETARGMRDSFQAYLRLLGLNEFCDDVVIKNIDTNQEIL